MWLAMFTSTDAGIISDLVGVFSTLEKAMHAIEIIAARYDLDHECFGIFETTIDTVSWR